MKKPNAMSLLTKIGIVEAMVFPVTFNVSKSWTLQKQARKSIDAFEFWC